VNGEKKKKGKLKKVSKSDKFQMASLQPACNAPKFKNAYYLRVVLSYEGCVCCINLPDAKMPMTIVPEVNPECFGARPAGDWNPTMLEPITCNLSHDPDTE